MPSTQAYLPPYGSDDLYLFVPKKTETPSIRAGTIDPASPYTFAVPAAWTRQTVANAISGNYCQPKCGEPWTEVIFSGPEGRCDLCLNQEFLCLHASTQSSAPHPSRDPPAAAPILAWADEQLWAVGLSQSKRKV